MDAMRCARVALIAFVLGAACAVFVTLRPQRVDRMVREEIERIHGRCTAERIDDVSR